MGAGRTTAPARGTESPREREPIGMEQVIADMAALMGGTLKMIAETQRAMAARVEGTGEPHRPRTSEHWRNARMDRFDGVSEAWVDYHMHFEAQQVERQREESVPYCGYEGRSPAGCAAPVRCREILVPKHRQGP